MADRGGLMIPRLRRHWMRPFLAPLMNITNPPQPRHLAHPTERTRSLEAAARQGDLVRVSPARHKEMTR